MFSYTEKTPEDKTPLEKIKRIQLDSPQLLFLPISCREQDLSVINMDVDTYIRAKNNLFFYENNNHTFTNLHLTDAQLKIFDQEFSTLPNPKKLIRKDLKKITALTGHSNEMIILTVIYSGSIIHKNKTLTFQNILEELPYLFKVNSLTTQSYWALFYKNYIEKTVDIHLPLVEIINQNSSYLKLKNFLHQWNELWFNTLEEIEKELNNDKLLLNLNVNTKNIHHIPVLGMLEYENILRISFLYVENGMDEKRKLELDTLLGHLPYSKYYYRMAPTGMGVEIIIPNQDIINQTKDWKALKTFIAVKDPYAYKDFLVHEQNIKEYYFNSLSKSSLKPHFDSFP